ncbi:trimethylamine methyltransferase family protein [Desulfurispora thermophila]|uniref:trimethylamine methyltransferase family protein n=1 Tax=Desulfurispora thermophila TaxID=265470 RepID=UPI00037D679A|nr:trimethylamine methyltransferase family protein [Desulfurispora thermophila]
MEPYLSNYTEQCTPRLKWLSEAQLEQIHLASLEVLERTGIVVQNQQALALLKEAGCRVREDRVWIPGWLVEECLRLAPKRVMVANRLGQRVMPLEKNRVYYGTGSDLPFTIDMESKERRVSTKKDVEEAALLMDYLPNYDFIMSYAIATDTPSSVSDLHQFAAMTINSSKPIIFTAHNPENTEAIIQMAAACVGGEDELRHNPYIILYSEPISPLVHTQDGVGKMFKCFDYNVPVVYTPGVLAGATTPVTKAGCITLMNAEALAGVVMAQLYKKGAPIIIGGGATPMDMKYSTTLYGAPETGMNYAAMTELAQFYGLPNFTEAGCTNSPLPDVQAGVEAALSIMFNQLCGANLVHDVGYLEGGKTGYLPFLVVCDDIIDMARYTGAGTRTSPEHLAVDCIHDVGPGGNYLAHDHTFKYFRQEIWSPRFFIRYRWEQWEEQGRETTLDRAISKVRQVLASHKPAALPAAAQQTLMDIIARRQREARS